MTETKTIQGIIRKITPIKTEQKGKGFLHSVGILVGKDDDEQWVNVRDFNIKNVEEITKDLKQGQEYEITLELPYKNAKKFSILNNNKETVVLSKERMIVRQNAVGNAIKALELMKTSSVGMNTILDKAEEIENWVMREE